MNHIQTKKEQPKLFLVLKITKKNKLYNIDYTDIIVISYNTKFGW